MVRSKRTEYNLCVSLMSGHKFESLQFGNTSSHCEADLGTNMRIVCYKEQFLCGI